MERFAIFSAELRARFFEFVITTVASTDMRFVFIRFFPRKMIYAERKRNERGRWERYMFESGILPASTVSSRAINTREDAKWRRGTLLRETLDHWDTPVARDVESGRDRVDF